MVLFARVQGEAVKKVLLLLMCLAASSLAGHQEAIFAHGFWDYPCQVEQYRGFYSCYLRTFSFPEVKGGWINPFKTNMAQEDDIDELEFECAGWSDIFLIGLSRGASAIITYLGTRKHDHVKAAVIESPFDKIESVVEGLVGNRMHLGWVPGLFWFSKACLPYVFGEYRSNGVKPIDVVGNIRLDLPILIVCCSQDSLVPASSSIELYKKLRQTGHDHVYLLVLDHGKHSKLVFAADAGRYKNVLHAFCRQYDLPFNQICADLGKEEFELCQPDF